MNESNSPGPEQWSLSQFTKNPLEWCQRLINLGMSGPHGNPQKMIAIIGRGAQLGLDPFTSLESIYTVGGRTAIGVDLMLALVERSGLLQDKGHKYTGTGEQRACEVWIARINRSSQAYSFSFAEAKQAGLVKAGGGWDKYLDSMLYARAMSFALRREFPDVLRGVHSFEEMYVEPEPAAQQSNPEPEKQPEEKELIEPVKPKRKRRTKAEMYAAAQSESTGTINPLIKIEVPSPDTTGNPLPPVVEEMSFTDAEKLIDKAIPEKSTPHAELTGRMYQANVLDAEVLLAAKMLRLAFEERALSQIPEEKVKVMLQHWPVVLGTISREKAKTARTQSIYNE